MKKYIFTLLALLCFTFASNAQGIQFFKGTLNQAMEQAAKENKLVFVDVYAVWCGPCKRMEATTFKDDQVGKFYNEHFVCMQIDSERGEGPSVHNKYSVQGLPSYLYLDSEGNIVHRAQSYQKVEKFIEIGKTAVENFKNPNSVGKYAARYEQEKNNVAFLKEYLSKLKDHGAAYYDVVEQYLSIQKEMQPVSKEMVTFLYDHFSSLTYGGVAQKIFDENLGTFAWDKYVRKDIRAKFQGVWMAMARQTTEYAIVKKDRSLMEVTFREAAKHGLNSDAAQQSRTWKHYYMQVQDGESYKKVSRPFIEAAYNEFDMEKWPMTYEAYLQFKKENPLMNPFCDVKTGKLRSMLSEYSKFVSSDQDKEDMQRWSKRLIETLANPQNISMYAKIQYMYGDKELGLKMMRDNLEATKAVDKYDANKKDLDMMEKGLPVPITF